MTLLRFSHLEVEEQLQTLEAQSVLIGNKIEGNIKVAIYKLSSFYVELFYQIENNSFIALQSFNDYELPYGYLDKFKSIL